MLLLCYHYPKCYMLLPLCYVTCHSLNICYAKCTILPCLLLFNNHDNLIFVTPHASFTSWSINQMCTFRESMLSVSTQAGRDEPRTPRHKPYHNSADRRQFSSSGKPHHESHLHSPGRRGNTNFTGHCSSPLPTPIYTIPHHKFPSSHLFSPAQAQEVHQPAPYASDKKHATCSNARPTFSGMGPRPGVRRMTKEGLFPCWVKSSALTGTLGVDALPRVTKTDTNVLAVGTRIMALRSVLKLGKNQALTLYNVKAWKLMLVEGGLLDKYPNLPISLACGFDAGIQRIFNTYMPNNSPTLYQLSEIYQQIVDKEFQCGCYISPCTKDKVKAFIRPFQSSPLSLVPKPGKLGSFCAVHNFSYPHVPSTNTFSINYTIDANLYPCTWGTFATICHTIHNLPPGSQASIQDVAEAYHTIHIVHSQWPGLVVKLWEDNSFASTPAITLGLLQPVESLVNWVTQWLTFFGHMELGHCLSGSMTTYSSEYDVSSFLLTTPNKKSGTELLNKTGAEPSQVVSIGMTMPNDFPAKFDEAVAHPIQDLASASSHSTEDSAYTYCDHDINFISESLGSLQKPFRSATPSLIWALTGISHRRPSLSQQPRKKNTRWPSRNGFRGQFTPWMRFRSSMASFSTHPSSSQTDMLISPTWKPCLAHLPPTLLCRTTHLEAQPKTLDCGSIPSVTPSLLRIFWAHASSQTRVLSLMPAQVLELASLSLDTGMLGISSLDGKMMGETLDGPKLLASSFLSALSSQPVSWVIASKSLVTIEEWSRVGEKEEVKTKRQIKSSGEFTTSLLFTNALLSHVTSPEKTTQLISPPEVHIPQYSCYYQPSTSPKTCSSSLSTTTPASFPVNRASQCLKPYQRLFQNQLKTSKNAMFTVNSIPDYMANGLRANIPSGWLKPNEIDTRNPPIFHQAAPNARPVAYSPLLTPLYTHIAWLMNTFICGGHSCLTSISDMPTCLKRILITSSTSWPTPGPSQCTEHTAQAC